VNVHPVWCLRKAQNKLRLRRFAEQADDRDACDNKTDGTSLLGA